MTEDGDDRNEAREKDSESEEGEGAEEILEESPCKRWSKRREQVKQRDVPGIDVAYLAMDNETGNEVVWNEVQFSERKNFRLQEEQINAVFDNLMHLVHTNLVKFHKYWTDAKSEKPRIIFITEYMSSGSMSLFLQRTRKSGSTLSLKAWKKWTTQILSALNYLHCCEPPIVHGNLTCNAIFIQQNGLIKIGCVAPNAIHHHVKTFRENLKNMHYIAPEYQHCAQVTPAADIYSFGICALEMAVLGGLGSANGELCAVTPEMVKKSLEMVEDPSLIESCLAEDPKQRPTARQLLFHTLLFEVHSLKLLAAHTIVNSKAFENLSEEDIRLHNKERIAATTSHMQITYNQVTTMTSDLYEYLGDVANGIYPLTAFAPSIHPQQPRRASSTLPSLIETVIPEPTIAIETCIEPPEPPIATTTIATHCELRSILQMQAEVHNNVLTLLLKLDDLMNRQLTTQLADSDSAESLVRELVQFGLVAESDAARVSQLLSATLLSNRPVS